MPNSIEFQEKACQLLDLENQIRKLSKFKIRRKDMDDNHPFIIFLTICPVIFLIIWKLAIPWATGHAADSVSMAILAILFYFLLIPFGAFGLGGIFWILGMVLSVIFHFSDNRAMEKNALALEKAQKEHKELLKVLYQYADSEATEEDADQNMGNNEIKYFFQVPFNPSDTAKKLHYGNTCYWNNVDYTVWCKGEPNLTENSRRIDGWKTGTPCNIRELDSIINRDVVLYLDYELAKEKKHNNFLLQKVYEVEQTQLKSQSRHTTTTSYNVEGAVKEYNSRMDALERMNNSGFRTDDELHSSGGMSYTDYALSSHRREKGEQKIRDSLAPTTHTIISNRCLGEELVIREKATVVFCENQLICLSISKYSTKEIHLTYELDRSKRIEPGEFNADLLPSEKYHGKITSIETERVSTDVCSTILYAAQYLSQYMRKPLNPVLERKPENLDEKVWRLWVTECYNCRRKRIVQ